ncbi:hypothetical protein IXO675_007800 [Xanthomonas oryzae pv. oryzae]|uniref:Uncharacterized protein n=2 Tax=Xanthomonas oryzae pv. oryzae TaxID=64187 RepID=A0A0K0GIN7_XANOP|nr:hypothetical protein PXO_04775 [Xanthomonas oryzae pv. oryzae PXO99A]AXM16754.1 hypothetical protein BRN66_07955 [Xanthomonas oryzae pv. oryzae]UEQ20914.1 hypothetical protein KFK26_06875 [Xanthomonas oryzae]BAE68190.1 conserved hypothetical protein [Xanthomonas oryzae pv. oryzae MAFF 311018]AXM20529.1 hypothetical protein BRM88_07985 [Xanthomonas oryzae pv. oryzae]
MKVVEISQRNNAPSADDPTHDVSIFSIAIDSDTPFWLEHSIRGGHAERGGCTMLALHERDAWRGDRRADVTKAGCAVGDSEFWKRACLPTRRRRQSMQSWRGCKRRVEPHAWRHCCIKCPAVRAPV